jgi:hypothetical protein
MHFKKFLCVVGFISAGVCEASGQTYRDAGGSIVAGVMPLPYAYTPLPPGQHNLSPTSATALTIPVGARYATVCASAAAAKYTTDGATAPTATIGQPLPAGSCVSLSGPAVLANFRVVSASGALDIEYFQ